MRCSIFENNLRNTQNFICIGFTIHEAVDELKVLIVRWVELHFPKVRIEDIFIFNARSVGTRMPSRACLTGCLAVGLRRPGPVEEQGRRPDSCLDSAILSVYAR